MSPHTTCPGRRPALAALSLLTLVSVVPAAEITLPPETARHAESALPGHSLANAMCLACHSADYVRTQPPTLPRATWKAIVTKMQKTFGAPIPDDAIDPIVDYLVKTYGAERSAATGTPPAPTATPGSRR